MSPKPGVLRAVGMLEMLYTARQTLGVYNSVIVTATYSVPAQLANDSLYSVFYPAISKIIHRHPSLCCYFEGGDTAKPQFRLLATVELKDVLVTLDLEKQESLPQKLQELHDQRWSVDRKPLWKLVVMREAQVADDPNINSKLHIAFVYHHVLGDGLSGIAFHRSLLRELETITKTHQNQQEAYKAIVIPESVPLIEPIEKLVALPLTWAFLIRQVAQEYLPRWLIGAPAPIWAGLPVQALDKCLFRSRARIVTIPVDAVEILRHESRKQGVTLTALYTAAIVSALANAIPEAARFEGNTPYTLRRITGTSKDEIVNQTSAFTTSYPGDILDQIRKASTEKERLASLWRTARYFHAQLQDEVARCPRDNLVGLLPYVTDHISFYQKKFGRPREATWELSNLGVFVVSPESTIPAGWRLENMTFTQGAAPVGPAFAVNCVSVQGGPLTVAITWQASIIDEDVVDALVDGFADLPRRLQFEFSNNV